MCVKEEGKQREELETTTQKKPFDWGKSMSLWQM